MSLAGIGASQGEGAYVESEIEDIDGERVVPGLPFWFCRRCDQIIVLGEDGLAGRHITPCGAQCELSPYPEHARICSGWCVTCRNIRSGCLGDADNPCGREGCVECGKHIMSEGENETVSGHSVCRQARSSARFVWRWEDVTCGACLKRRPVQRGDGIAPLLPPSRTPFVMRAVLGRGPDAETAILHTLAGMIAAPRMYAADEEAWMTAGYLLLGVLCRADTARCREVWYRQQRAVGMTQGCAQLPWAGAGWPKAVGVLERTANTVLDDHQRLCLHAILARLKKVTEGPEL